MAITGETRLLGLIGWPVAHTRSPAMHNAAARAAGLDVVYVPLPVRPTALETAVKGLAALGFAGANVTVPHKQAVLAHLDAVEPAARAIGAVNTISVAPDGSGALTGHNTDWQGLLADLAAQEVPIAGRLCLLLGAGGAARAAAYALSRAGGAVEIFARRRAQAATVVADLQARAPGASLAAYAWGQLGERTKERRAPLIVNCTPLGMHPDVERSPWPAGLPLPPGAFIYDLVYNPRQTKFMQQAQAAGCRTANGLGMLLYQGALAFELWTGVWPDVAAMAAARDAPAP